VHTQAVPPLKKYYLSFAISCPVISASVFILINLLLNVPTHELIYPWVFHSISMILICAPLLRWAHRSSRRFGSAKFIVLAVEAIVLLGVFPMIYFLIATSKRSMWPLIGILLVLFSAFIYTYYRPPKRVQERLNDRPAPRG
jgi:hypothetical protein